MNIYLYVFVWACNLTYVAKYLEAKWLCHPLTLCLTLKKKNCHCFPKCLCHENNLIYYFNGFTCLLASQQEIEFTLDVQLKTHN